MVETGSPRLYKKMEAYILGWQQPNGKVAILCRSSGSNPGPAFCSTKKEAIRLRTKLANDPRGKANKKAQEIIKRLLIYIYVSNETLMWRPGDLWVYVDQKSVELLEEAKF